MKVLDFDSLTNKQFINIGFVCYGSDFKKETSIYKTDQGYAALNVVEGEASKKAFVYDDLKSLYLDYKDLGYMVNYGSDLIAECLIN